MKGLEGYGQNRDSIRCEHVSILQSEAHTLRLYPEECLPLGARERDMVSMARPQPSQNTGRTVQRPHGGTTPMGQLNVAVGRQPKLWSTYLPAPSSQSPANQKISRSSTHVPGPALGSGLEKCSDTTRRLILLMCRN